MGRIGDLTRWKQVDALDAGGKVAAEVALIALLAAAAGAPRRCGRRAAMPPTH